MTFQQMTTLGECLVQVEAGHAPRRSDSWLSPSGSLADHHHGAIKFFGQSSGDDANHARVPPVVGQHQRGSRFGIAKLLRLLRRGPEPYSVPRSAAAVHLFHVFSHRFGPLLALGDQQFDREFRLTQSTGGVESRSRWRILCHRIPAALLIQFGRCAAAQRCPL